MKYKILFLTNVPSPYKIDFLNELGKVSDLTVVFERDYSPVRDKSWNNWEATNFKAIVLNGINLGKTNSDNVSTIKRSEEGDKVSIGTSQADMAISPKVIKYIDKSYDRIIVGNPCSPTGIIACYYMNLRKIPHGFQSEGAFPGPKRGLRYWIKKSVFSKGDFYFSTADLEDDYYLMYGAEKEKIKRFPFSSIYEKEVLQSPLSIEEKRKLREELNIPYGKVVISVGRLIPNKGYDKLIKSMEGMPDDIGMYIIGGEPSEEYKRLRDETNPNIHFVGFQNKESLIKFYRMSDVFAINTRLETWGLFVNEALSQGIPVITTNRCFAALAMIENGKDGFILDVDDVSGFSNTIKKVMDDGELYNMMAKACLKKARAFTIENEVKRVVEQL